MIRRLPLAFSLLVALLSVAVPVASAHTEMTSTSPADGAVLELSPQRVVVVFNDAIQQDRSSIVVLDTGGATIAEGGLDPDDATRLAAELPPLDNGEYVVRWTAYSQDNELLRDQFEFEVAAATPAPTAAPTPAPTPTPTVAPSPGASAGAATPTPEPATPAPSLAPSSTPTTGGGGDGQTDTVQVLIPLLVGGAIVAAIAVFLVRRRRQ